MRNFKSAKTGIESQEDAQRPGTPGKTDSHYTDSKKQSKNKDE